MHQVDFCANICLPACTSRVERQAVYLAVVAVLVVVVTLKIIIKERLFGIVLLEGVWIINWWCACLFRNPAGSELLQGTCRCVYSAYDIPSKEEERIKGHGKIQA